MQRTVCQPNRNSFGPYRIEASIALSSIDIWHRPFIEVVIVESHQT
jgi:hypothetical protein